MGALIGLLGVLAALITIWAVWRKGVSGLPLIFGVWGLILSLYLAGKWVYPTPEQLILLAFVAGAAITLLTWGCVNIFIEFAKFRESLFRRLPISDKHYIILSKQAKSPYGILYGAIPWNEEGMSILLKFLNEEIWGRGYKLDKFVAEYDEVAGAAVAWIIGILRPKTFIDRILY
ncbi:MAG: hypothetical protein DRJ31_08445 [Candidatus Methanomethylicota archaeon]|uniref:Uncharacterized protein n=1 Tax=Thermoproteota archaeon TaxID=2056631 RepID=A0A497END6_9CREN|nr:MAG: hypothetical protein DRJ31_08445 [Candidatus Verstraetearchaeota archaeon]